MWMIVVILGIRVVMMIVAIVRMRVGVVMVMIALRISGDSAIGKANTQGIQGGQMAFHGLPQLTGQRYTIRDRKTVSELDIGLGMQAMAHPSAAYIMYADNTGNVLDAMA
jgi:hypothetical protein